MGALPYIILLAISLGILVFLLTPVSLRFDSTQKYLNVEWMGLSITKSIGRKKPGRPKEKAEKEKKGKIKALGLRLLRDRGLIFELLQKGYRSMIDLLQSVSIREIEATFSTPDPVWNGVLYGIFTNIHFENVNLSMNFQNINYVRVWGQFYSYKIVKVGAGLLIRLPYRRIIRTALYTKKH